MPGFVRVHPHRGVDPVVTLGDGERRVQMLGTCAPTRHEQVPKPRRPRPLDDRLAVGVNVSGPLSVVSCVQRYDNSAHNLSRKNLSNFQLQVFKRHFVGQLF